MKTNLSFIVIWILLAAGCTPPRPPSKQERAEQFARCFREEMNPSPEQITSLQALLGDESRIQAVNSGLQAATDKLEKALESPKAAEPELLSLFKEVDQLKSKLSEDHFHRMLMLRSLLSDEQKARFLVCKRKLGPPVLPHE